MFERIKGFYDRGLWRKEMVAQAVDKGIITAEQYAQITGEKYAGEMETQQNDETA